MLYLVLEDFISDLGHMADHIMEIVSGRKQEGGELFCFEKMVEEGSRAAFTSRTVAALLYRPEIVSIFAILYLNRPLSSQDEAVASRPRRVGAVEGVDTKRNQRVDRGRIPDAEQMARLFRGHLGRKKADEIDELCLRFADASSYSQAIEWVP